MNEYLFNSDDNMEDVYHNDYYKWYDGVDAAEWDVLKKILAIHARPPCSGSSRWRVPLYNKRSFISNGFCD